MGVTSANANGGVLQLKSGITFPATAVDSSDANTLDDYEEGTWTPTITSGATGTTFDTQTGGYVKVGSNVIASMDLDPAGWTANANNLLFGGLPFTSASNTFQFFGGGFTNYGGMIDKATVPNVGFHITYSTTNITVYNSTINLAGNAAGVNVNNRIILNILYRAA